MNHRSEQFIRLAKQVVEELELPNVRAAKVGGSVGRGDADSFSDLDLTVYVSNGSESYDQIFVYQGEIIQLFVTDQLPTVQQIGDDPWEHRFILETIPIYDPKHEFTDTWNEAKNYYFSVSGRERTAAQAIEIVNDRKKWAIDSLQRQQNVSARLGAGSAWADAAFMHLWFVHNTLSTGALIPITQLQTKNYEAYIRILPFSSHLLEYGFGGAIRIVERYRQFLRAMHPAEAQGFYLSSLQDLLIHRKAQRLYQHRQLDNLLWQLFGEVFMLFLEFANGKFFEEHACSLPPNLQHELTQIGFAAIDEEQVMQLLQLSDDLVSKAQRMI
ncbi:nucleotidyltransferase domain-containing protein [Paenibacillus sp. RC67]|uniref:nucleotidyltransferase domain-containing protein n=1 Tax=Paenibacillus sp. RC67 TaxID=3039392 RepID=UPI0024AE762A|nr:nucleotidyltransferase domain-containing protein [Paenibacillus sp. RC67]